MAKRKARPTGELKIESILDVPLQITVPRCGSTKITVDVEYDLHDHFPYGTPGDTWYTIEAVKIGDLDVTEFVMRHPDLEQAILRYLQANCEPITEEYEYEEQ